jgi:hypothetical protein
VKEVCSGRRVRKEESGREERRMRGRGGWKGRVEGKDAGGW